MRFLILLGGVALLGCNAATTTSTTGATTSATRAPTSTTAPAAYAPLLVAGLDVSCNGEHESVCDEKGCRAQSDGMIPLALSYNGATGLGQLCMGESCDGAYLTALPAADAPEAGADLIGAIVSTGAATEQHQAHAPSAQGIAVISRDHASFQVMRGSDIWSGRCERAVHEQ